MNNKSAGNSTLPFHDCRRARLARDPRMDGIFFSGSATTGIYCRSTCPGTPPLESNNVFFHSRAQAEAAGFRPCLRCRPELAPGPAPGRSADWRLHEKILQGLASRDTLNTRGHQLNMALRQEDAAEHTTLGATLPQYCKTHQLGFAKQLITDTALSVEDIARITRFDGSRDMLKSISQLYRRDPLALRNPLPVQAQPGVKSCALMLAYRPPLDWSSLLAYFGMRSVAGVEIVADGVYQRSFGLGEDYGWLVLQNVPSANAVRLEVHAATLTFLMPLVGRVRRMLGLDADPRALEALFARDPLLGPTWRRYPGLRVPMVWDPFEFAVRAVVGQLISVKAATKLVGNIVAAYGEDLALPSPAGIGKVFPHPAALAEADLPTCGLTRTKATAIASLARTVPQGIFSLTPDCSLDAFIKQCTALPGIGDWTAQSIAMRGLGHPDAFPAGDLGIVKALSPAGQRLKPVQIHKIAQRWRPWRAHAAMLLWMMGSG